MTPEEDALRLAIALLNQFGIAYMVTGSVASSFYGRPRTTHDVDVVIDPTPSQMDHLVAALTSADFYANADAARQALTSRRQFNAIHTRSGAKIDLIVKKARPFSDSEFGRRTTRDFPWAKAASLVSAEDAIISKLEWAKAAAPSDRHLADARAIVELNPALDRGYIEHWVRVLGLVALWETIATVQPS